MPVAAALTSWMVPSIWLSSPLRASSSDCEVRLNARVSAWVAPTAACRSEPSAGFCATPRSAE
jgi:hypothetical protein